MLELAEVSWSNFLSFGDYVSSIDITKIKECTITGVIEDEYGNVQKGKSNGAGKSTIPSAIQWCLFDRTGHSAQPGNKIRNFYTKQDTWVKVTLTNGDSILRTRKVGGTTEVVYFMAGREECMVADTLSTMKVQQAKLSQVFGLDWDIFSKNVFFSCFDNPWMQLSDQKRKEVLEKLFKLDRLSYYNKSAVSKSSSELSKLDAEKEAIKSRLQFLSELKNQIERQKNQSEVFEQNRANRINDKLSYLENINTSISSLPVYDLDSIKSSWSKYNDNLNKINVKINELNGRRIQLQTALSSVSNKIRETSLYIDTWKSKKDKECISCGQLTTSDYTEQKIQPKLIELSELKESIPKMEVGIKNIDSTIINIKKIVEDNKPNISLQEAASSSNHRDSLVSQKNRVLVEIESIKTETSPIEKSSDELKKTMVSIMEEIKKHNLEVDSIENKILHIEYIKKAYSDRNKIKKMMVQGHIPFFNERLRYYLDIMELDVKIQLTDNLGVESNCWSYEYESNGEKRRTDVAMMFSAFDTHEHMYGRQCNILVLDEVDGQIDGQGIDSLVHIIKNDISNRVGTVFVISHKQTLQNVFGSEIIVRKRGKFSYLD